MKNQVFLLRPYLFRHDEGDSSRTKSIFLRQPSLVRLPQSDVFILFYGLWHSRIKAVQLKNKQFYNYRLHCDVINIIKALRHIKNTQCCGGDCWGWASLWTCVHQHFLFGSLLLLRQLPASIWLDWMEPPLCWLSSQNIKEIPPPPSLPLPS